MNLPMCFKRVAILKITNLCLIAYTPIGVVTSFFVMGLEMFQSFVPPSSDINSQSGQHKMSSSLVWNIFLVSILYYGLLFSKQ